jgi:hypothetical protein
MNDKNYPYPRHDSRNYHYHHSLYRPYPSESNLPSNNIFNPPIASDDNNCSFPLTNNSSSCTSLPPLNKTLSTSTLSFHSDINLPPLNITNNQINNNNQTNPNPSTSNLSLIKYIPPSTNDHYYANPPSTNDHYYANPPSSYYNPYLNNYSRSNRPIFNNYHKRYHPYYYNPQYDQMYSFRPYQFNTKPRTYNRRRIESRPYDQKSQYVTRDKMKTILTTESG